MLFSKFYFIFGCAESLLLHTGFLQLHRAGATLFVHRLLMVAASLAECGLWGAWALSVVCRPSCSVVCRIFPDQGSHPCPLHWQVDIHPFCHQGSPNHSLKWSEVKLLSCVRFFATPWTVAYQASPSMGFSRQEYWSGLPFPSPGESSRPRDGTHISAISCVGRQILYRCATWDGPDVATEWPWANHILVPWALLSSAQEFISLGF